MASFSSTSQPSESKKRQRVSIACLTCRGKHIRCDGVQPICGFCQAKSTPCNFAHYENKRRPPSKKLVESLQARIRNLEEQLQAATAIAPVSPHNPVFFTDDSDEEEEEESLDEGGKPDNDNDDPLSELTGLVGRLNMTDDGQVHYFGSQSSYHLVKRSLSDADPGQESLRMQTLGLGAASQLKRHVTVSPELQEHLLHLYWQWQNPWNYIVHKEAFMTSFRGEDDGRNCSPLLLSCIFAMAARYSDHVELRTISNDLDTAGDAFCEQAKILMLFESEAPTITTVQASCILALRIMSAGKEALGWLYAGNATRMAHNLGLHLDVSELRGGANMTEQDSEVRRVTWWGCYVVDKLFSVGLGRPSSTPKSSITCPKPRTNGGAEYEPWFPPPMVSHDQVPPMVINSHIASNACHLSDIMTIACEAMDAIYSPSSKLSSHEMEKIVTKADVELRSHFAGLPSYLRPPASLRTPMLPHVCLLHVQYHAHLILLHRPLVWNRRKSRRACVDSSQGDDNEDDTTNNTHMKSCRHSAAEITRLLRFYKQQYTLRRIPIAAVHLCFAASIIHLIDARPTSPNQHQAVLHLQTCVEILQDLRVAWSTWSDRATRAVQLLASEWYGVSDLTQLQKRRSSNKEVGARGKGNEGHLDADVLDLINDASFGNGLDPGLEGEDGPESFMYYTSTTGHFMDDMLKGWLDESMFPFGS